MIELHRKDAIRILQYYYLFNLTIDEKGNMLYGLNNKVFNERTKQWDEVEISKYRNTKKILAMYGFGNLVSNEYFEKLIFSLLSVKVIILDHLAGSGIPCDCCSYIVTTKRELFDICPVCQWEITNTSENEYSGPNHSTLKEYREKFLLNKSKNKDDLIYIRFRHVADG